MSPLKNITLLVSEQLIVITIGANRYCNSIKAKGTSIAINYWLWTRARHRVCVQSEGICFHVSGRLSSLSYVLLRESGPSESGRHCTYITDLVIFLEYWKNSLPIYNLSTFYNCFLRNTIFLLYNCRENSICFDGHDCCDKESNKNFYMITDATLVSLQHKCFHTLIGHLYQVFLQTNK